MPVSFGGGMARKAFSGDHVKELPKGKVEPYRLWFEFLKLALEIQPEKVDKKFYEPWDDVTKENFNDWFPKNWQKLFALPASLTVIESINEAKDYFDDEKSVIIRVDKTGPVKRQIEDFKKILKAYRDTKTKSQPLRPAYEIISKRSMNNAHLRAMLRILAFNHKHNGKIDEATRAYYEWASNWNKQIRDKKWKREIIKIPVVLTAFDTEIKRHKNLIETNTAKIKKDDKYYSARRAVNRFLRNAQNILDNVSVGKFPGNF
jgi:hypothetical protein